MKGDKEEVKAGAREKGYCTKGWNWGNYILGEENLSFNVDKSPCFSLPFSEIANANITNKNEITIELHQDDTAKNKYIICINI